MASDRSSGAGACQYCKRPQNGASRQYLDLQPLCFHELPPHVEFAPLHAKQAQSEKGFETTLVGFLNSVLTETYQIQWDDNTWRHHGTYPSEGSGIKVVMPALSPTESPSEITVPVDVDKRVKGKTSFAWLARRSRHNMQHVDYQELDAILAQDHCRKEGDYDLSVFDANELLKWDSDDLRKAMAGFKPEWRVNNVQMAIFQMFHEMPKVLGKSLLQDRVFHVLVITVHSTYILPSRDDSTSHLQSHTVQLPISIDSLRDVEILTMRSHIRPKSLVYEVTGSSVEQGGITQRQVNHNGNSLTEGTYVSVERLRQAPDGLERDDLMHRWDMMTRSDARGISRLAPWSTKRKETLEAIAKDVKYVLDHIRKQRMVGRNVEETTQ